MACSLSSFRLEWTNRYVVCTRWFAEYSWNLEQGTLSSSKIGISHDIHKLRTYKPFINETLIGYYQWSFRYSTFNTHIHITPYPGEGPWKQVEHTLHYCQLKGSICGLTAKFELGIPCKTDKGCRSVNVGNELPELFDIMLGFRQNRSLSLQFGRWR